MPDRLRESIFNILGSRYDCPSALPPIRVADVFAGGGSMGLEALSRGAASCCFYERGRQALVALRRNLQTVEAGSEATVVTHDAWASAVLDPTGRPHELVLFDPPYRDTQDLSDGSRFAAFLRRLAERDDNRPFIVLHHAASVRITDAPDSAWQITDQRESGTHAVTFFAQ